MLEDLMAQGEGFVELRDGSCAYVYFQPAEDDTCEDCFHTAEWDYCWEPDGRSVTRPSLDMVAVMAVVRG